MNNILNKKIPDFLIEKIKEQYDEKSVKMILDGLSFNKKTTFRINRLKTDNNEIIKVLNMNNLKYETINFFDEAFILEENSENIIKNLDIYSNGKIYLQSLSSMLPVFFLEPKEKENILDMCAAPRRKNYANS